jgi:hypothetical protein
MNEWFNRLICSGPTLAILIVVWAVAGRRSTLSRQIAWTTSIVIVIPLATVATLMIFGYDEFDDEEHFYTWITLASLITIGIIIIITLTIRSRYCLPVHLEYEDLGAPTSSPFNRSFRRSPLPPLASEHARNAIRHNNNNNNHNGGNGMVPTKSSLSGVLVRRDSNDSAHSGGSVWGHTSSLQQDMARAGIVCQSIGHRYRIINPFLFCNNRWCVAINQFAYICNWFSCCHW